MKINAVRPQDNIFTNQLASIAKVPNTLYYCGELPSTPVKSVAIVGSRKPTPYGKSVTEKIVHALAEHNVTIISGLALGIDSIAHRAALKFNTPTIAVMARGLNGIYPASHFSLSREIVKAGGALISTYPADMPAQPYHFLERNRIISGLSSIVIVTEAAVKSGTLNTASHALEQGKDVFAVPGNITSPMSAGCNRLIRQGAQPLIDTSDILSALGIKSQKTTPQIPVRKNKTEQLIINAILAGAKDTNQIINATNISPSSIFVTLSTLEIAGIIESSPDGVWTISQ
ncbi:DNA-processing protein DprA [Candidatus Saccharibacteria bacterium]|nr:DNA-processing protein DprA [Candidatus Saccharibacteria bacterium]